MSTTNLSKIQLALFLLFISSNCVSHEKNSSEANLLTNLFPNSAITTIDNFLNSEDTTEVISGFRLRNNYGIIPVSSITSVRFADDKAIMSFEIYLQDKAITNKSINNFKSEQYKRSKLLQVIFYNPTSLTFIAKPKNYPLSSTQWSCLGEICESLDLIELTKVGKLTATLVYNKGFDNQYLQFFSIGKQLETKQSEALKFGDFYNGSGCDISINYSNFIIKNNTIHLTKSSQCNESCEDVCSELQIETGSNTSYTTVELN